ncbi:tyrosine-type recombinase/integrase [Sphingobium sp. JS3065]|uniref:tyrosine-type recombinase/integrase n=1 Tax=Sphingobium sp. JS3065 TaxID=2970925 RepID=UPI002B26B4B7|nr:phage integrase N-terminal SAM-like domain-containing protein [Sphingobium sp. JS3065]
MTDVTVTVSPLRRRMIDDMSLRNLSPATQRSYLHAVTKFSRYFGRSPDRLGPEDVRAFQVYLVSQGISWGSLNQIVCALRFFYGVTLDRAEIPERIVYARMPRKLPTILSADEVVRFLEAVPSLKARAALTTAYAAGLRASEAASLKVTDIDSDRMVIQVRHGKGAKDRSRRSCLGSCGLIGGSPTRRIFCSPDAAPIRRSPRPVFTPPAGQPPRRQD